MPQSFHVAHRVSSDQHVAEALTHGVRRRGFDSLAQHPRVLQQNRTEREREREREGTHIHAEIEGPKRDPRYSVSYSCGTPKVRPLAIAASLREVGPALRPSCA